jgi:tRNA A-37 threonylcarbamoyl transferase component Bud32
VSKKVTVETRFQGHEVAGLLKDFDAVEALIKNVPGYYPRTTSKAYRVVLGGLVLFVKYYQAEQDGIRFSRVIRSKPSRERNNLKLFRKLAVPTLQPVAVGVKRRWGVFQTGYLATLDEPDTVELSTLARTLPERLSDRSFFAELASKLADGVRRLHRHNFFHNDLNWRNVLIRQEPELEVMIFDSPIGRRWHPPLREHRLVKDLAALDRLACVHLSRTRRLRFYLNYAERESLTVADKKRLVRVMARSTGRVGQDGNHKSTFVPGVIQRRR